MWECREIEQYPGTFTLRSRHLRHDCCGRIFVLESGGIARIPLYRSDTNYWYNDGSKINSPRGIIGEIGETVEVEGGGFHSEKSGFLHPGSPCRFSCATTYL